jgi:hypothetical protein
MRNVLAAKAVDGKGPRQKEAWRQREAIETSERTKYRPARYPFLEAIGAELVFPSIPKRKSSKHPLEIWAAKSSPETLKTCQGFCC